MRENEPSALEQEQIEPSQVWASLSSEQQTDFISLLTLIAHHYVTSKHDAHHEQAESASPDNDHS